MIEYKQRKLLHGFLKRWKTLEIRQIKNPSKKLSDVKLKGNRLYQKLTEEFGCHKCKKLTYIKLVIDKAIRCTLSDNLEEISGAYEI